MKQTAEEIRTKITESMVSAIQQGTPPWRKPWSSSENTGFPCNFRNAREYSGINPLILMFSLYNSKYWGSESAWLKNVGASTKTGEEATYITLFRLVPFYENGKKKKNSKGQDILYPLLRLFPVFNAEQLQPITAEDLLKSRKIRRMLGSTQDTVRKELLEIAEQHKVLPTGTCDKLAQALHEKFVKRLNRYLVVVKNQNKDPDSVPAENFLANVGATINHGGTKAFYNKVDDNITLPFKKTFESISDYYETAFHEIFHWASHPDRVGTKTHNEKVNEYAFNELVAEIGACFLLMEMDVPKSEQMIEKSKSYVASWLTSMKNDPKYIFDAAAQASKVVKYLLSLNQKEKQVA